LGFGERFKRLSEGEPIHARLFGTLLVGEQTADGVRGSLEASIETPYNHRELLTAWLLARQFGNTKEGQ
jgi:hypothetical protein